MKTIEQIKKEVNEYGNTELGTKYDFIDEWTIKLIDIDFIRGDINFVCPQCGRIDCHPFNEYEDDGDALVNMLKDHGSINSLCCNCDAEISIII